MKNNIIKLMLLAVMSIVSIQANAQQHRISGTIKDDFDVIPGANVVEIDKNNRIVSQAITDMNGNFTLMVKDPKNKLRVSFMGMKTEERVIGNQKVFNITMKDNTKMMTEVQVTAKKKQQSGGLSIPVRELAGATQTFNMDEMEGMAFESVDQALQGQIAGLDIIQNSGNLGSGTTMRLRGISTLNGDKQPLIVVNDHIFDLPEGKENENFSDYDTTEQFSTLLNVNPEDILSIEVLKDGASAKWGARGANGVIEIKMRRGHRGPTNITFSYRFNGTWQGDGYKMLDGDGYTMMLKEAYYNPRLQSLPLTGAGAIPELDYNHDLGAIYYNYNRNTDWVEEVKKFGQEHKTYMTISGGGEKAQFRVSAGYDHSTGSIIGQKFNRFTTNTALDYDVSDRIKFSSTISLAFTDNKQNAKNILGSAYQAMPNMSVWERDVNGYETGEYFYMLDPANTSSIANDGFKTSYYLMDMFANGNPVAWANKAWNKKKQYNLNPQFNIEYKLLGKDDEHTQLNYKGDVWMGIYNTTQDSYIPAELHTMPWQYGRDNAMAGVGENRRNEVSNYEEKVLDFSTRHELAFYPYIRNTDHSVSLLLQAEWSSKTTNTQGTGMWNVPTGITDPTVEALITDAYANHYEERKVSFFMRGHYSYKSKYNLDFSLRSDGSSRFGKEHRFGLFPWVGIRYNIIDEPFMKWSKSWLSMLAVRASWSITGNMVAGPFDQYNSYGQTGYNYNGHSVMRPSSLSLKELQWENVRKMNLGFNVGLLNDLFNFEVDIYDHLTTDMVLDNKPISSANGFSALSRVNGGEMRNYGWELNFSTGWFAKIGKFQMKLRANVAQNFNVFKDIDPLIEYNMNTKETDQPGYINGGYNLDYHQRVQVNNALGSIYGLKYKGVYRYDYDHNGYTMTSISNYGYAEVDQNGVSWKEAQESKTPWGIGTGYDKQGNPINTAAAAARRGDANATCPIAYDANGNMVTDQNGNPMQMYYCYNESYYRKFEGGDAIYEDINHDGQIDHFDMVYLGNSNPKCNGGFGFTLKYGRFQLMTGFNFRIGHQIINMARRDLESMVSNRNQSYATTWRWRKNGDGGDEAVIPRAMSNVFGLTYNSLPSDRYVEDGDYLRLQYVQLSYDFDPKKLKKLGIRTLKLFASVNNIFCWSKYTGIDPEVSPYKWYPATDRNNTPVARSFTASINLGF